MHRAHEPEIDCTLDVVFDLRLGSPSYGKHCAFPLSAKLGNMVYIPKGIAHGFLATSEEAILMYKVTSVHSPSHDQGLRWDSIGFDWPEKSPILSRRDRELPPFEGYSSPFVFKGA